MYPNLNAITGCLLMLPRNVDQRNLIDLTSPVGKKISARWSWCYQRCWCRRQSWACTVATQQTKEKQKIERRRATKIVMYYLFLLHSTDFFFFSFVGPLLFSKIHRRRRRRLPPPLRQLTFDQVVGIDLVIRLKRKRKRKRVTHRTNEKRQVSLS